MPHELPKTRRLIVLGSTGSIGTQTLDVVEHINALADSGKSPIRYDVVGLAAGSNTDLLSRQAARFDVASLALARCDARPDLPEGSSLAVGPDAAQQLVRETRADLVMASIVGAAGLPATLAAIESGTDVALANKETLVMAGSLVIEASERSGARLLPVDSEHAGVWHALRPVLDEGDAPPFVTPRAVRRVTITASGGAFRDNTLDEVYHATPEQALAHPNWSMGAKVTIDSATLINKGLELIEAHHLFGLGNDRLEAVIQRQSVVHALAELSDGAVIAHLSATDMRHPILCALAHPHAIDAHDGARLDLSSLSRLDFSAIDQGRFPAIGLARQVIGHPRTTMGSIMNAANEAAVGAFIERKIPFGKITELVAQAMEGIEPIPLGTLADATTADAAARAFVEQRAAQHVP